MLLSSVRVAAVGVKAELLSFKMLPGWLSVGRLVWTKHAGDAGYWEMSIRSKILQRIRKIYANVDLDTSDIAHDMSYNM